jgi:ABC-2 type transport system permease protein
LFFAIRTMLWAVMLKELRQAFRDKRMAVLLLGAPILQLVLFGYAVDLDVDRIPSVVCDQDRTPTSRRLIAGAFAEGTFAWKQSVSDPARAMDRVREGKAAAAWIVPPGFEKDQQRGTPSTIQVLVDGTDTNRSQAASAAVDQLTLSLSRTMIVQNIEAMPAARAMHTPTISPSLRILYNPTLRSATFMVPGLTATILTVVTTLVTAMGIVREKEMGTMEQLLVTPLRPWVLLLGKSLPFALVGMLDVAGILAMGTWLFAVPIRGSLWVIFSGAALYLMSTLGAGVFISTISSTQQQAILGGFMFLLPSILLSGFMTPIENMPAVIQWLTYINPVRYFVEISRSVMLKGAGFSDLYFQFAALGCFGVAILALSALRFKKRLG